MKKMTKEMKALADEETEVARQTVILSILGKRAEELGASSEIRETLTTLLEKYVTMDLRLITRLDALAAAQEARHE